MKFDGPNGILCRLDHQFQAYNFPGTESGHFAFLLVVSTLFYCVYSRLFAVLLSIHSLNYGRKREKKDEREREGLKS